MSDLLRKAQLVEYEILKEVDRIAKKHNIKYYLGRGTLLGAAKYKKFIPWDDDIDLLIPYKDLTKLFKVFADEADSRFLLTNCFVEKHFPLTWSKVRDKETLSRPYRYKDLPINWGICIDLFPIFSASNNYVIRKIEYLLYKIANKIMVAEFTKYEDGHGMFVRFLEKIPIAIRHLYFKTVIGILKLHKDDTKYVLLPCKHINIVERDIIFGKEREIEFEDAKFPAVSEYEKYLTITYGDWRADLPYDEQRGHDMALGEIEWKVK